MKQFVLYPVNAKSEEEREEKREIGGNVDTVITLREWAGEMREGDREKQKEFEAS